MMRASVVLPEPGGPQKTHELMSPRRISSPSAFPGPRRCSWPRNSSRVRGRMRAARGSAEREKRVGSDTGNGKWETGNERHEKSTTSRNRGTNHSRAPTYVRLVRQLEALDVWRGALDLAEVAYRLTMEAPLQRHFALVDQVRRAAISIPANIAEGYALSTTMQFVRCLRISLGSASELRSHLELIRRLNLAQAVPTAQAAVLCVRVISMLVGLLRALARRTGARFPFPVSRVPTNAPPPTASS